MPDLGSATSSAAPAAVPRVLVSDLSKTFAGTRALIDVTLAIEPGEIHALVGGNGSGKSTLIKVVTGVHRGDSGGSVSFDGATTPAEEILPSVAYDAGVRAVHQDLGIFPSMTVAENLALGDTFATGPGGWIRRRAMLARARALIDRFEIPARPNATLAEMSRSAQTLVAIARALQDQEENHGGLLILDEPTAALPAHEVELLLASLKRWSTQGQSILYVSHRLDEVLEISDRVSVLRDGRLAGTYSTGDLDEQQLVTLIVGRRLEREFEARSPVESDKKRVLDVKGLKVGPLTDVSFSVAEGEIVGIAGLMGSGRSELLRAVAGDLQADGGEIKLDDRRVNFKHPADAIKANVSFIPENRGAEGAFLDMPVRTNALIPWIHDYWRSFTIRGRQMRHDAQSLMSTFLVKSSSDAAVMATLSGGNQQKVIAARWLQKEPRLMLLDEPTQGVDVGARAEIYRFIRTAVDKGAAAVVVASDFEELAHAVDRALVLRNGEIVAEAGREELQADRLTHLANGLGGEN